MNTVRHPLVELSRSRGVRAFSLFSAEVASLSASGIADLYALEKANAPRRSRSQKTYFVGHSGYPTTKGVTNRDEEHLAIAIFNAHRHPSPAITLPTGEELIVLDYQVPLKSRSTDASVGKVDLFGATSAGRPCVIELKVRGRRYPDTPLRGLLEALAYAAIVDANIDVIGAEARTQFGIALHPEPPQVIVLAPSDYWAAFRFGVRAPDWSKGMLALADDIAALMGVQVLFLEIVDCVFSHGSVRTRPQLASPLTCRPALKDGPITNTCS